MQDGKAALAASIKGDDEFLRSLRHARGDEERLHEARRRGGDGHLREYEGGGGLRRLSRGRGAQAARRHAALRAAFRQERPAARAVFLVDDDVRPAGRSLVANPINRYSIGDRTRGLKYGADGSLDLYVQHVSPGKDKASNWLPAPTGAYTLIMRIYGPEAPVFDGTWQIVKPVKAGG